MNTIDLVVTATAATRDEAGKRATAMALTATTRTLVLLSVRSRAMRDGIQVTLTYSVGLVDRPEDL